MAPSESFDPRTWKREETAPAVTPATSVKPAIARPAAETGFRWWMGPALSLAILLGGALAAYATGSAPPAAMSAASAQ
jgi:hypothetical protein